ncbi:MAG: hypothetical protein QOE70_4043 [Chthoniobacter sp.]|jgi:hypothetical protein|nr:hypothetical protein [Chthoniobacter sp.]
MAAPVNTETLGNHQPVHIGRFRMDRRGLMSGSVQRHVKEAFDAVDFTLLKIKSAPRMLVPCVGVEREYSTPYGIYTYTYEGIDPAEGEDESLITFELDITMEEVPIVAHPHIKEIEAKYGKFSVTRREFPRTLPAAAGTDDLSGGEKVDAKVNPLAGTDSYLVFGATFKKSYVRAFIPKSALRGIGSIISRPLGLAAFPLPTAAKHRKWLKVAPKITKRGNCVQIEENYIMSGRHGIVKEIYGANQLEEDGDDDGGGGGGLSSGGL